MKPIDVAISYNTSTIGDVYLPRSKSDEELYNLLDIRLLETGDNTKFGCSIL